MSSDKYKKCGPGWINNLRCDIDENTAQPEDVQLFMEYCCHLYKSSEDVPIETVREILKLINQSFNKYLEQKQFSGALEAAFGFTGIQGDRNLGRRNEDIATDVAKYRLKGKSVIEAVTKVSGQRDDLSHSTINEAWSKSKETAYIKAQIEYGVKGKKLSPKQYKIMEKDLKKIRKRTKKLLSSSKK
jgi:hypothetical protein